MLIKRIKLLLVCFFMHYVGFSQANNPVFCLYSVPQNLLSYKAVLNKEIQKAHTKEEVRNIIRTKATGFKEGRIVILYNQNQWFTLEAAGNKEQVKDIIVTQTKDVEQLQIDYKRDFKHVLKDTLVILDTISLQVFLQDEDDYPNNAYFFTYRCNTNNKEFKTFIPLKDAYNLLISDTLFKACHDKHIYAKLYNSGDANKILAECMLIFLSREEQAELKQVAEQSISENQQDLKKAAESVDSFVRTQYGFTHRSGINNLISRLNTH